MMARSYFKNDSDTYCVDLPELTEVVLQQTDNQGEWGGLWCVTVKDTRPLSQDDEEFYKRSKLDPERRRLVLHLDGRLREHTGVVPYTDGTYGPIAYMKEKA